MLEPAPDYDGEDGLSADEAYVLSLFARVDTIAFAVAGACVAAVVMFFATAILLLVGPAPAQPIGTNLWALSTFWPGYSVTWGGAFIGAIYGGICGALGAFFLAVFWNLSHLVIVGFIAFKYSALEIE